MLSEKVFPSTFLSNCRTFREFDAGNTILFQIKFFAEKIILTMLAMHLMKTSVRSSFTRLRNITLINIIHERGCRQTFM